MVFEDDNSSSVLVFNASRSGLYELPAHLGKSDSCSDCQSMCVVGNVELASDADNSVQRAQLQEGQMFKRCHRVKIISYLTTRRHNGRIPCASEVSSSTSCVHVNATISHLLLHWLTSHQIGQMSASQSSSTSRTGSCTFFQNHGPLRLLVEHAHTLSILGTFVLVPAPCESIGLCFPGLFESKDLASGV